MSYKQFDREEHTDIISSDLRTTFHIYRLFGHDTWRINLSKFDTFSGKKDNEITKQFIGFKSREEAVEFVRGLVRPELIYKVKI